MSVLKELSAGELKVKVYETREIMGCEAATDAAGLIRKLLNEKAEVISSLKLHRHRTNF